MGSIPQPPTPLPWRQTPLVHSTALSTQAGCKIYLKLENLQPSGSFKSRGIGNFLLQHLEKGKKKANTTTTATGGASEEEEQQQQQPKTHFYSSSGGNAGLACVHAAVALGAPATIVVPLTTTKYMMDKMRAAGATDVVQEGASWYEADRYLREMVIPEAEAAGQVAVYVPPFDAEEVWDGHATLVKEVYDQMSATGEGPPDAIVCSVGGGGLLCGIVRGLDEVGWSGVDVLAVETKGADSLALSVEKGELSTLPAITSIATTLGARTVAAQAFEYAKRKTVKSVVLSDTEAIEGCVRFADDERIMVEASCGVSIALCYGGRLKERMPHLTERSKVVIVVCGGSNVSVDMLFKWAALESAS